MNYARTLQLERRGITEGGEGKGPKNSYPDAGQNTQQTYTQQIVTSKNKNKPSDPV